MGTRTPSKMQGSGDPWMAARIASNIQELGYGGPRVVLKADQEVAIADVHRQVVAARSSETVPMNSARGQVTEQRQDGGSSVEGAGSDQKASRTHWRGGCSARMRTRPSREMGTDAMKVE